MATNPIQIVAPTQALVNTPVQFSFNLVGVSYIWNFGDGITSTVQYPMKTYSSPGTYNVTLTTTYSGQVVVSTWSIVISPSTVPVPLTLSISGPLIATVGQTVQFTANPSGGTPLYSYSWNANGLLSNTQSITLTPSSTGNITITCQVNDAAGSKISSSVVLTVSSVTPPPPGNLLHKANLTYVGAFRVPAKNPDGTWVNYSNAGTALAYNPANNSLFMVGNTLGIGEVSIPSLVNSSNLSDLKTATILQKESPVLPKVSNPDGDNRIGGLMVYNGQIIGTAYVYYDANATASKTFFIIPSTNVNSAISGLYSVSGAPQEGYIAGYMCSIPAQWQSALGKPCLTGLADVPIISRSSSGPSAFGFDPTKVASGTSVIPYLYYTIANVLGPYEYFVDPLQNTTTQIPGVVFPSGANSVLFFGNTGSSMIGYGINSDWGDSGGGKGGHSMNGEYVFQAWAYNVNDLIAVKNGTKKPWELAPYDVWNFTLPLAGYNAGYGGTIGGVAFDPATNRIYLSVTAVDNVVPSSYLPVIYCFQLNTNPVVELPRVGVVTGYPNVPVNTSIKDVPASLGTYYGAVKKGDPLTLVASNVYYAGGGITGVNFFIDGNFVGSGKANVQGIAFADHNWSLSGVSTSNLASGNHTVTAIPVGNGGSVGPSTAWTLKVK